jgi:hypothetical protein
MATMLFTTTKDLRKTTKTYRSKIQITPYGHQILAIAKNLEKIQNAFLHPSSNYTISHQIFTIAKNLEQIIKCIFTSIIKLHLVATRS